MMKKFMKKLWEKKDSKKGFTLVELIVVLVILAILAAIMVPALLGWIDEAKQKQYVLEARGIYMAAQARASEHYAAGAGSLSLDGNDMSIIQRMADVDSVTIASLDVGTGSHGKFTIEGFKVTFDSSDGSTVTATLTGGESWTINSVTAP